MKGRHFQCTYFFVVSIWKNLKMVNLHVAEKGFLAARGSEVTLLAEDKMQRTSNRLTPCLSRKADSSPLKMDRIDKINRIEKF
jgi:hypothetical protein